MKPGFEDRFLTLLAGRGAQRDPTCRTPIGIVHGPPNVDVIVVGGIGSARFRRGGPIHAPNIERLAARGIRYTSFHSTGPTELARSCDVLAEVLRSNGYCCLATQDLFDRAIQLIHDFGVVAPRRPFFLHLHTAASIERADLHVGGLVECLERAGRLEDTLLILLSFPAAEDDAGEAQPGRTGDTMIVHWPAGIGARGGVRSQDVYANDVAPTVLDILGFPSGLPDGTSFAGTLLRPDDPPNGRRAPPAVDGVKSVYYPGSAGVAAGAGASLRDRSHVIVAQVVIPESGAEGVLLAQGGRLGGSSLFVKGNRLWHARSYVDAGCFALRSDTELPAGPCVLAFEFRKRSTPTFRSGMRPSATSRLFVNGWLAAEAGLPAAPAVVRTIEGDAVCCGYDGSLLDMPEYRPPFRFSGVIRSVVVDVSGDPYDPEGPVEQVMDAGP
jgi:hypothetical protein